MVTMHYVSEFTYMFYMDYIYAHTNIIKFEVLLEYKPSTQTLTPCSVGNM